MQEKERGRPVPRCFKNKDTKQARITMTTSPVKIIGKNVKIQPLRRKSDDSSSGKNSASKNGRSTHSSKSPINKLFSNKNPQEGIGAKVMKMVKNPLGISNKKKSRKKVKPQSSTLLLPKSASEPCLSSTSSNNSSSKESRLSNLSLASSSTNNSTSSSTQRKKSKKSWPKKKKNTVKPRNVERTSPNPRLENNQQLVFPLDVKTQMTRLVTPRQRQEVFALNRTMTRLENEKFKRLLIDKNNPGNLSQEMRY
ncbi:unnamed protein product [Lepeophtheirus salmonis]|uniref:(salmon louse) hypothetical protein n=1 Tax=Lepeophtheirus salmonis TaxID=72036 RepID=A0A7R8CMZ9_LEPSM|nr:unnamed protein product [Lepeophtheirus salmonis]CAF2868525.1 unnamed protein product [Lepeophtheirus salmonis]